MADQTELRMNLVAIKRVDPYAKDIVDSSAHVAFYTFNSDETEWEKTDVEGAFFIYSRNAEPYHSIFINNRLNKNSLVEPVTGQIELQSQPPFLLYRNERSRIRGFWFYNKVECNRIGELIERLVKDCELKGNIATGYKVDMQRQTSTNIDIFSMLSKAQEDFNNSQMAPISAATGNLSISSGTQLSTNDKSQQPPDVTSQSVMNFFAAAKPAAASEVPIFQRMLSQPVHVDQIEKQQRAITPQEKCSPPAQQTHNYLVQDTNDNNNITGQPIQNNNSTLTSLENGVNFIRINSPNHQEELGTSPFGNFINSANLTNLTALKNNSVRGGTNNIINNIGPGTSIAQPSNDLDTRQRSFSQLLTRKITESDSQGKPALMPPTMFATCSSATITKPASSGMGSTVISKGHNKANHGCDDTKGKQLLIQKLQASQQQAAKSQLAVRQHSITDDLFHQPRIEPLTQNQLIQAVSYLLKNDADFSRKLHEAYVKSFTEINLNS